MKTIARLALAAGIALGAVQPAAAAAARPVTDCPLRNAPFSADSPVIDIMLSQAAKAVLEKVAPGRFSRLPARFAGTTPPTFAAIMTLRTAGAMTGLTPEQLAAADADLRKLPVTAADKAARCARYDDEVPRFDLPAGKPRLLVFEKINGFRDVPSVDGAHAALQAMAQRKGWAIAFTDKGGAFNPRTLRGFDAVIWNNISGDVLTLSQRQAFRTWIEQGGAYVGMHGSAGDPAYFWDWYVDTLLGARFLAHPMGPQFQDAKMKIEAPGHPVARGLPGEFTINDEWYSFKTNPRKAGATVIATLDESTYSPVGMMNQNLRMGDHPIAWTNCIGRGRMFYTAVGHRPETYVEPHNVAMLENGIDWAAVSGKAACPAKK